LNYVRNENIGIPECFPSSGHYGLWLNSFKGLGQCCKCIKPFHNIAKGTITRETGEGEVTPHGRQLPWGPCERAPALFLVVLPGSKVPGFRRFALTTKVVWDEQISSKGEM